MGKNQILTREQRIILDQVSQSSYLKKKFYFTGGTALSSVYLKHRFSEDLDFFTENTLDVDEITRLLSSWAKTCHFTYELQGKERVLFFYLKFKNKQKLKVDFAVYPYPHVESTREAFGIQVDSLFDIAINKFSTIQNRTEVKDFVDLYFLLKKFTFWDLFRGVEVKKGVELNPFHLAAYFTMVDTFAYLPKMVKPLTLKKLQAFFLTEAKNLGSISVAE